MPTVAFEQTNVARTTVGERKGEAPPRGPLIKAASAWSFEFTD
jgi:hypothetical protein